MGPRGTLWEQENMTRFLAIYVAVGEQKAACWPTSRDTWGSLLRDAPFIWNEVPQSKKK